MQTNFSAEQLADPDTAASEAILRKCVHCGFCTATCPTYLLLGDELDSPRGRIYLIKDMLEQGRPATSPVVRHLDRCLSCLGCVTTCPSGVDYQHLIDHARAHVERTYRRPLADRWLRALLASVLPHPGRFRLSLRLAALARPFAPLLPARLQAMLALAPRGSATPAAVAAGPRTAGRVAVLCGCVQAVVGESINAATLSLLERAGFETVPIGGCCGSIVHHLGRDGAGRAHAAALIERLMAEIDQRGLDAIAVNASGCGTHLKDLGFIFRNDAMLAGDAARISALARDVTELLAQCGLPAGGAARPLTVAYHSACSMQHGQGIDAEPRALLGDAGFTVVEIAEGHICCGSAGTYNMLQPALAARLGQRKLEHIVRTRADVVATGNLGCMTQLAAAGRAADGALPIVHTVELLDWATGGAEPAALTAAATKKMPRQSRGESGG